MLLDASHHFLAQGTGSERLLEQACKNLHSICTEMMFIHVKRMPILRRAASFPVLQMLIKDAHTRQRVQFLQDRNTASCSALKVASDCLSQYFMVRLARNVRPGDGVRARARGSR